MSQGEPPRRNLISAAPIARIMRDWVKSEERDYYQGDPQEGSYPQEYPTTVLAGRCGVDPQRITRVMNHQEWVDFDLADRLLIAMDKQELWVVDPELRELYENFDLGPIDLTRPTCEKTQLEASQRVHELLGAGLTREQAWTRLGIGDTVFSRLAATEVACA